MIVFNEHKGRENINFTTVKYGETFYGRHTTLTSFLLLGAKKSPIRPEADVKKCFFPKAGFLSKSQVAFESLI